MVLVKVLPYSSCLLIRLLESLEVLLGGSSVDSLKEEECRVELNCHERWPLHVTSLSVPCSSPSKEKMAF